MDRVINSLIYDKLDERSEEFKDLLIEADVRKLSKQSLWDIQVLPVYMNTSMYFILEYKLQLLINKKDNESAAYLSYLISYYLFNILTPVFGRELFIKYAEEAVNFNGKNEYKEWLEFVKDERNVY